MSSARPLGRSGRLGVIDVARGVAVTAMVIYHSAWDLSELRLIETDIRDIPAWSL
ncbi:MAG TPA: heparan-alpha-glucosaminide N-acetyltransferase domain-containing protein, partial [Enterovirga sp.]